MVGLTYVWGNQVAQISTTCTSPAGDPEKENYKYLLDQTNVSTKATWLDTNLSLKDMGD